VEHQGYHGCGLESEDPAVQRYFVLRRVHRVAEVGYNLAIHGYPFVFDGVGHPAA